MRSLLQKLLFQGLTFSSPPATPLSAATASSQKLMEKAKPIPGAKVENNKFCVSVHFRCVEEKILKHYHWRIPMSKDVIRVLGKSHGIFALDPIIKVQSGLDSPGAEDYSKEKAVDT
ncbi:hypothetical protein ZIOFF_047187 [Zingiber officinale]|uniref:Uncharacterized protein n=1 Tax=Zingiber officinale TaxID=94328 RepID=A0A8J5FNS6_ZINOF|nr:hypothetical protein ZIOFF_047187 [Zingiber officinale]